MEEGLKAVVYGSLFQTFGYWEMHKENKTRKHPPLFYAPLLTIINSNNNNTYIAPISILLFSSALKNENIKKIYIIIIVISA